MILGTAARLALGLVLALSILPACAALLVQVWQARGPLLDPWYVLGGCSLAAALVWWKRPNMLVHTTIHELCHVMACVLLGVRVRAFQTTDGNGGSVLHDRVDPVRTTIIALAPYTIPLLLAPVLLLHLVSSGQIAAWFAAAAGFLFIHHLHALYHNIRINFWSGHGDLAKAGRLLSVVVILSVLFLVMAWCVATLWA